MTTRIAFLRAVNLGKRTVRMARLVELFEGMGHDGVWTHINSGNVVFEASGSRADIEHRIERTLEDAFGFEVTTFVRTATELRTLMTDAPFDVAEGDTYFVTFLKSAPRSADAKAFESLSNDMDTVVVQGRDVHWLMHGKSTDSSLRQKDWARFGANGSTSRNVTMLRKLVAKIDE